jgi:hypothetical protein
MEDVFNRLDDTRFNLIVVGQPGSSAESLQPGDILRVHEVANDPTNDQELARAHIPRPSFYLLRPDGHVGLAGPLLNVSLMMRYLSDRVQLLRHSR